MCLTAGKFTRRRRSSSMHLRLHPTEGASPLHSAVGVTSPHSCRRVRVEGAARGTGITTFGFFFLFQTGFKLFCPVTMELSEEQLKVSETELRRYLPRSLPVYGFLMHRNRVRSDPLAVFVDRWPDFNVLICRPTCREKGDLFKDIHIFANDKTSLEETIRKSSVIDWTRFLCLGFDHRHIGLFKAVASEKEAPGRELAVCQVKILEDVSKLPDIDSSGMSLSSLDESHVSLVNQTWKFSNSDEALVMIRNIITNFPSCCHRGKGYAKVLICSMARRLHAEGYPVYTFIEEENTLSHRLFTKLGFTEAPSFKTAWMGFNEL
ncbi:glycine N-acyltransferase-like isoform X2 [Labrus mixtus]|uniref:glycine N-acyltransferase-like isoform X2 n=1 Tax=Labrus mixtus TaxID=508554 RepID=UPI0029BFBA2D|nr:glycine N-acyltransferase-like isoform X2 [Labrus mixtus]